MKRNNIENKKLYFFTDCNENKKNLNTHKNIVKKRNKFQMKISN